MLLLRLCTRTERHPCANCTTSIEPLAQYLGPSKTDECGYCVKDAPIICMAPVRQLRNNAKYPMQDKRVALWHSFLRRGARTTGPRRGMRHVGNIMHVCVFTHPTLCTLRDTALNAELHCTTPHRATSHHTTLHYTMPHDTTVHYTVLHYSTIVRTEQYNSLLYNTEHDTTLH